MLSIQVVSGHRGLLGPTVYPIVVETASVHVQKTSQFSMAKTVLEVTQKQMFVKFHRAAMGRVSQFFTVQTTNITDNIHNIL